MVGNVASTMVVMLQWLPDTGIPDCTKFNSPSVAKPTD